jgi:orotate phosphoribosyltransferase
MVLPALPAREGHFRLESGLHTDVWITLDALFVSPLDLAPLITALAARLKAHTVSAVCGPLLGGAFLAITGCDARCGLLLQRARGHSRLDGVV